ncbi:hypothetical protein QCE47_26380 [Caballeronia sp. LZ025]|uniref:tyrosine-type recombinase/integrase n=1 Tax=Caballeronia TaxID=1827195 RepID=UPI001FD0BC79|nr:MULTISPECIES: hypothetical protein [Caballeronia]MDR5735852.1 hypothetical protein [Caballeronia sp. LZ025]
MLVPHGVPCEPSAPDTSRRSRWTSTPPTRPDRRKTDPQRGRPQGTLPLRNLKLSQILTAIASRRELSDKTINSYVSVLRLALSIAVADELIPANVAESVSRAKHPRQLTDPFSREESEAIIPEAARMDEHSKLHRTVVLVGLRTSEINGLEWRYVDFKDNTIGIERVLVAGGQKNRTKTAEARLVRLNSRSRAALLRQRAFTQVAGRMGVPGPAHGQAVAQRGGVPAGLPGAHLEADWHRLPPALRHAAPPVAQISNAFNNDARVLREAAWPHRRNVPSHLCEVDRRQPERPGDGAAGIGAHG